MLIPTTLRPLPARSVRQPLLVFSGTLLLGACLTTPPLVLPPGPDQPVEPPVVESGPPLTIAVPPSGGPSAQPAPSVGGEFDVDGLVIAPDRRGRNRSNPRTPAVHQVSFRVQLTKKWSANVGVTTFRTTMGLVGDTIVIGTHGKTLKNKGETTDGVYVLEARTGKVRTQIRTPGAGDLDVGGIAVDNGNVYFTTDNSQIVAASLQGNILWTAKGKGKIRPAPALADLNGDGQVDVVVGDEEGELLALEGKSGKKLWTANTGQNSYSARGFLGAAALVDLDGDGKDDVVAGARDGILTGYRGSDGRVLWQVGGSSGIHASPVVADLDQDGKPEILAAWSYSDVAILDGRTGRKRWQQELSQDSGGIEGLFGTPVFLSGTPGVVVTPTAWWGKEDGIVGVGMMARAFKSHEGRVSSSGVVTDLDGDGRLEAILGTEQGAVVALHTDGGYGRLTTVGGAIEATPMLADTDGNGTYELLVASNDGQLTCFETGSRAVPALARFRGESLHNRGAAGTVRLGWRQADRAATTPQVTGPQVRIDYLSCCQALQEEASRAPSPQNLELLKASMECIKASIEGAERANALGRVRTALQPLTPLPRACR